MQTARDRRCRWPIILDETRDGHLAHPAFLSMSISIPGSSRESPMPRRGVCGLESADWATSSRSQLEFEVNLRAKSRGNPGFREIPVWRSMGGLGAVRPPGEPDGAAWAASRADSRRSTIINGPGRLYVAASLAFACVGAGRSVPARARHLAAGPPEIKKKGNCAPVCADPVDL
jgi:hypothetical protein